MCTKSLAQCSLKASKIGINIGINCEVCNHYKTVINQ